MLKLVGSPNEPFEITFSNDSSLQRFERKTSAIGKYLNGTTTTFCITRQRPSVLLGKALVLSECLRILVGIGLGRMIMVMDRQEERSHLL